MDNEQKIESAIAKDSDFDLSQELADILSSFSSSESTEITAAKNIQPNSHTSIGRGSNHRTDSRYAVRWNVAIVDNGTVYHGRTCDLSLSGASILLERNNRFASEIVLLLAIPPTRQGQNETIVEIQGRPSDFTTLDSTHHKFRLRMEFLNFKKSGKTILSDTLSKWHIPMPPHNPRPYTFRTM